MIEEVRIVDIAIGADVVGRDGKLGSVHRVIVDARSNTVTDLIVKHGFAFSKERILPLGRVTGVDGAGAHVDMDQRGFEALNGYTDDRYRAPDPSYIGPPGYSHDTFLLDAATASLGGGGTGSFAYSSPPLGFPGGQQVTPDDLQRPVIQPGTDVRDADGEKVGEVETFSTDPATGAATHFTLRQGHIFTHDAPLPADWIAELSDKGVVLRAKKADIDALIDKQK